ncbi:MAG: thioesterase family protein [Proteobacteria bacterium]|nr:thioesterase family protein [Pseudomonadota bacterium]
MDIPAPFEAYRDRVREEWIDYNGHMNVGYYVVVFDYATDAWLDFIGLTSAYREKNRITTFTLEEHTIFLRELRAGAPLRFTTRLIGHDAKRIHYFHQMYHADEGFLASTNELMSLHVSQKTRRSAPMAPAIQDKLAAIQAAHDPLPPPPQLGRVIGLESGSAA